MMRFLSTISSLVIFSDSEYWGPSPGASAAAFTEMLGALISLPEAGKMPPPFESFSAVKVGVLI